MEVIIMSSLNFIIDYESGELESEEAFLEGFQELIDSGQAWQLQGHYGRTASYLIDQGLCQPYPRLESQEVSSRTVIFM